MGEERIAYQSVPESGQIAKVRQRHYVVTEVKRA